MDRDIYVKEYIAELLHEKGYNEPTWMAYCTCAFTDGSGKHHREGDLIPVFTQALGRNLIPAPTQPMAVQWLKERHGIEILVSHRYEQFSKNIVPASQHAARIQDAKGRVIKKCDNWVYDEEEALDDAIVYTLSKIISRKK